MKMSESIKNLAKKLSKAQGEMETVKFDSENKFYGSKFASLAAIMEVLRPVLFSNNLALVQGTSIDPEQEAVKVETMIIDGETGEYISETLNMKIHKNTPAGIASAITYCRRYSVSAMLCLATSEDDDAEMATERKETNSQNKQQKSISSFVPDDKNPKKKIPKLKKNNRVKSSNERVNKIKQICSISKEMGQTPSQMKSYIGRLLDLNKPIENSDDLSDDEIQDILNALTELHEDVRKKVA